jgi:hypothetical protein
VAGERLEQKPRDRYLAALVCLRQPESHHIGHRGNRLSYEHAAPQEVDSIDAERRHLTPLRPV